MEKSMNTLEGVMANTNGPDWKVQMRCSAGAWAPSVELTRILRNAQHNMGVISVLSEINVPGMGLEARCALQ